MAKKWIALLLLVCILGSMLIGCKGKITADEAAQIALAEIGIQPAEAPHVHESTYENKPCFNVFISVGELSLVYVISDTGNILYSGPSDHHH